MKSLSTKFCHQLRQTRTFIDARIKLIPDRLLDDAVSREKNLKQVLTLKNQIISSKTKALLLSSLSPLKPYLNLPITISKFFQNYPLLFTIHQPNPHLPLHVKLTPLLISLHKEERQIHHSLRYRSDSVIRLAKLLMLTGSMKLPMYVIDKLKFDLGLPYDYVSCVLSDYPDWFSVCSVIDCVTNKEMLVLELVRWREDLAVSSMERRVWEEDEEVRFKRGLRIRFSMSFSRGFDLRKKVANWVDVFQDLPYVSPYENAFHLRENSDQAEKWAVAVLHELLWLLVSKKTEKGNVQCFGEYLGFGNRFDKILRHHPGIFYVSNKIRTQTIVLREAFRKGSLVEKHPLMEMRYKYARLMNRVLRSKHGFSGGTRTRSEELVDSDS
ncbi:hypothetical protein ACFE04_006376 [Oxalis oulophora]